MANELKCCGFKAHVVPFCVAQVFWFRVLVSCLMFCGTFLQTISPYDRFESLLRECRLIDMDVFRIMFLSCWKIEAWFLLSVRMCVF